MFIGTLPRDVASILRPSVESWGAKRLYVGCSGEFTVERAFMDMDLELHGNDVSLYSVALGQHLIGEHTTARLNPDREDLAWLAPFMETPEALLATIRLSLQFAEPWNRREENSYFAGMARAFQSQFPVMHQKVLEKLAKSKLRLTSFSTQDIGEYQDQWTKDPEAGFICFPSLSKGPDKMYKHFDTFWSWPDAPVFNGFDAGALSGMFSIAMQRDKWAIITQVPMPDIQEHLVGTVQNTARGSVYHVYTDQANKRQVVVPNQKVEDPMVRHATPEDIPGAKLGIFRLTNGEFQSLRSQYLNARIRPGSVTAGFGVTVNGLLLGVFAIDTSTKPFDLPGIEAPTVYLMSDFPVVKGKRIAKLVVMAALSKEAQILMERITKKRVRGMTTTAFTEKPVSMKYRNVFKLLAKNEASEQDKKEGYAWKLSYGGVMGEWTLAEAMKRWEALNEG